MSIEHMVRAHLAHNISDARVNRRQAEAALEESCSPAARDALLDSVEAFRCLEEIYSAALEASGARVGRG